MYNEQGICSDWKKLDTPSPVEWYTEVISSSQKAGCCRWSTLPVYQRRFYFPRTRGDGHTLSCHQVFFDRYHGPHIMENLKGYLIWKACPSSIDLKNERHGTVSILWAPQSEEGPDRAVQLLPLSPSEKSPPRLRDQAMCFSRNQWTAYTTYYSWNVQKVDNLNCNASP